MIFYKTAIKFPENCLSKKTNIIIIHLNVCSLLNKFNEIELLLKDKSPDVLCITETWLPPSAVPTASLDGYELISHFCRCQYIHGGCAIYAKCNSKAKGIPFIAQQSEEKHIEACGLTLQSEAQQDEIIIICVYRPPSGEISIFLNNLANILISLLTKKTKIILCGDLNIDSMKPSMNLYLLQDLLESFSMLNHCNDATRMAINRNKQITKTAIDYVITNINSNQLKCSVFEPHISDHKAQLLEVAPVSSEFYQQPNNSTKIARLISDENLYHLRENLSQGTWNIGDGDSDVEFEQFIKTFLWHFDITCPLYNYKPRHRQSKPWVTLEIQESSRKLRELHTFWKNDALNQDLRQQYNEKKKTHKRLVALSKKHYYQRIISEAGNKPKKIWEIVNKEIGRSRKQHQIVLKNGDDPIHEDLIPDELGKYFSTIATKKLAEHFKGNLSTCCTTQRWLVNSMVYEEVTAEEISEIISTLPNRKSCGSDGISTRVLKTVKDEVSVPIAALVNKSVLEGKFPKCLKIAVVIPILKKGDPTDIENYRPISLLSAISKIVEICLHKRIVRFLTQHRCISASQNGFLSNRSIETATFDFFTEVYKALDVNRCVAGLFFDLSKAFDLLDISFLKEKLCRLGIRGFVLDWLISFLSNRELTTKVNGRLSGIYNINVGAAQGSVLSPLLFICYINDLKLSGYMVNYADDMSVVVSATTPNELLRVIQVVKDEMNEWCQANRLILNTNKTVHIHFFKSKPQLHLDIFSDKTVFLGTHIDEKLNWQAHIDHICKKINNAYFAILKLKPNASKSLLLDMYYALIYSHLNNNIILWGQAAAIKRVFISQKRVLRLIFNISKRDSCREIFKKYSLLTLPSIYIIKCATFAFKYRNKFVQNNEINSHYTTRTGYDLCTPAHTTALFEKAPLFSCIKVYNKLPNEFRRNTNIFTMKKRLKKCLLDKCYYSVNEYFDDTFQSDF
nr:unnamed protein product [Callosobruchus analis]